MRATQEFPPADYVTARNGRVIKRFRTSFPRPPFGPFFSFAITERDSGITLLSWLYSVTATGFDNNTLNRDDTSPSKEKTVIYSRQL
ncbi:MAG TPA: hypothetical protein VL574_08015 [Stellaceae bacterium]|nr:hypothetical protein [Stellaceae bacterium]